MALTGSSSPHFYLARSRSTSLPPLSSSSSASGSSSSTSSRLGVASFCSSLTWPNHALPCLALAFDEPSFFADLRVDINPIITTATATATASIPSSSSSTTPSTTTTQPVQSSGTASPEECCRSHSRLNCNAGLADDNQSTPGGGGDHGGGREEEVTPPPAHRETDEPGRDCVWVHRMVVAVHSPVFRSLLRHGGNGTRESREGVIDMRGPQHPPGRVVRCMLKMMYASPGLAIDELGHEPKLSDEWEFLLQLYKLAHLYQVEVVLDACTRRLKHILERKDNATRPSHQQSIQQQKQSRRGSKVSATHQLPLEPLDAVSAEMTEEDEERTRQTCFALELLAFLLHVKQAETSDSNGALGSDDVQGYLRGDQASSPAAAAAKGRSVSAPEPSVTARSDDSVADDAGGASASDDACERKQQRKDKSLADGSGGGEAEEAVDAGEQREELLVRMLDYHLYPQLAMIVQHIRCEDVLTLQHLLHLSVCCRQTSPSSPTTASLTPQWPGHTTIQRFKP